MQHFHVHLDLPYHSNESPTVTPVTRFHEKEGVEEEKGHTGRSTTWSFGIYPTKVQILGRKNFVCNRDLLHDDDTRRQLNFSG